jgi:hypothetical protein
LSYLEGDCKDSGSSEASRNVFFACMDHVTASSVAASPATLERRLEGSMESVGNVCWHIDTPAATLVMRPADPVEERFVLSSELSFVGWQTRRLQPHRWFPVHRLRSFFRIFTFDIT